MYGIRTTSGPRPVDDGPLSDLVWQSLGNGLVKNLAMTDTGAFDDDIYREVGRVALAWSRLERRSHNVLWMYSSDGQPLLHGPSRVLIAGMVLDAQWDAIEVFLSTHPCADPESLKWFKDWRRKAVILRTGRNDAVHSSWTIDGNDPGPSALAIDEISRKARGGQRWNVVPGGKIEVAILATDIDQHHVDLASWAALEFRRLWPKAASSEPGVPPTVPSVVRIGFEPSSE